ncbi:pyrroline-5-carboxylate reductase [Actinomycetaceae bacterium TAE3-ERU4]|nr:pyrroline-5-carboxylate reductase [Actinomycetaceae bacterium TAE3-ERU4]
MKTIGFLGAGNMAGAIVRGLVHDGYLPTSLLVTDRSATRAPALAQELGVKYYSEATYLVGESDILVLGMKPHHQSSALENLRNSLEESSPLVISLAAGRTCKQIENSLPASSRVIRAMPNVAAAIGESITGLAKGSNATSEDLQIASEVLAAVGKTIVIEEEYFPAFTALAGCSPAWFSACVDALAQAGVSGGISKKDSTYAVANALIGTGKLILNSLEGGAAPARIIDSVCSPGGSTVAGLLAAESSGLRKVWLDAFSAALKQDQKISKK